MWGKKQKIKRRGLEKKFDVGNYSTYMYANSTQAELTVLWLVCLYGIHAKTKQNKNFPGIAHMKFIPIFLVLE